MEHPRHLRLALCRAIEAGDEAAAVTRRIALGNRDPQETGTGIPGLTGRWPRWSLGPPVTVLQVERACRDLDDFVTTLGELNEHVTSPDERIDTSDEWAARLRGSIGVAADVHNEVTATLATLGRYRVNVVLRRPLLGVDAPGQHLEPGAAPSGHASGSPGHRRA